MGINNQTVCAIDEDVAYGILITIYTAVFIGGFVGIVIMVALLCRTNTRSVTMTAVINLLVVHSIFLLTVPFRITYYVKREWIFGLNLCKIVSAMIHVHVYLCFIFYVTLLVIRFISFFKQKDRIEFYRTLHSVVASSSVWAVILVVMFPILFSQYGKLGEYEKGQCFHFEEELIYTYARILNYIIIFVMFTAVCSLLGVQIFIIVKVVKNLQSDALDHQMFWVQLKSLFFILVMIICFFPYHMFRIYFLNHTQNCFFYNEIYLSITALSCMDLLLFALKACLKKVCQSFNFI
ncbi:putative G-protein coupled receptor 141 [Rhinophrynus dorsalis]